MALHKGFANNAVFFARVNKGLPRRLPLRSIQELAEEFGLTMPQLRATLQHSTQDPPKPALRHHNSMSCSNTYYDPILMREWWKRHNACNR
jgi:hypothetical protein